jgi:regulatory protein
MPEGLEIAVRLLARREHSAYELRNKLKQRQILTDSIDEILEICLQRNLQSDLRFAEMLCRSRINRGYGPVVIRQRLQQARVSVEIIKATLDAADCETHWQDAARHVWEKKFQARAEPTYHGAEPTCHGLSEAPIQKQQQFLRYRGFTETTIKALFEALNLEISN